MSILATRNGLPAIHPGELLEEILHDRGMSQAAFAKAIGLSVDLGERGLGTRSQRYAMVVDDGVVKTLNVEDAPGKADISGAENLLKGL